MTNEILYHDAECCGHCKHCELECEYSTASRICNIHTKTEFGVTEPIKVNATSVCKDFKRRS